MVYKDPFAQELTNINTGLQPAPVVAPTTSPNPAITGVPAPITDTRTFISSTPKAGYIQGYDTTQGYAPVYVPRGQYVAGISATGKDLTTDKLADTSGYILPNGQPGTQAQADQAMAAAKAYSDSQAKIKADELAANPAPTKEANDFQTILNNMVTGAEAGTAALTERQNALQGQELKDLTTQRGIVDQKIGENIAKSAALDASYQQANVEAEGSNFNLSRLAGAQAQNYRMYLAQKNALATETGLFQATSLGLSNRLTDAKALITDTFNAKVDVINSQIKNWEAQANALRPTLDKQEAAQLEIVKARKAKELQDAQDLKTAQIKASSDLLDAGVSDSNALLEINKATTDEEVNAVMARYAPELSYAGALDIKYKEAQIQNVYSQMNERGEGAKQYDPSEILAYAQQYASTGKIPTGMPKGSFGLVSQIAKESPKPEGTLVDRNTGIKPDLSATQEDGITALFDITKKVKELADLDKQRIRGVAPAILGKVFGSEDQQRYVDLRGEIVDLLARARTGAALTTQEEKFYTDQLPGRVARVGFVFGVNSRSRIENFDKKINDTLKTKLGTLGGSIYGFSKVKVGEKEYKVGDIVSNGEQQARVNPDGTLTLVQ